MFCADIETYCNEISDYFNSDISGYPFVVNVDDFSIYQQIVSKIEADSTKKLIKVSDFCNDDNFPNIEGLNAAASSTGCNVVIGISQYIMLQGDTALKKAVYRLVHMSVSGHTVILLNGCNSILKSLISTDIRLNYRVVIGNACTLKLPGIVFVNAGDEIFDIELCDGVKSLLKKLEIFVSKDNGEQEIAVKTHFSPSIFKNSMYPVSLFGGAYDVMAKQYKEIASSTERRWGTDEQWGDLLMQLNAHKTLSAVIDNIVGSTVNLSSFIDERFENEKSLDTWYLWLAMKVFGTKENHYLSLVLSKSNSVDEFVELLFMELLNHKHDDTDFEKLYKERRHLIERLPENLEKLQNYCDHVGEFDEKSIYYLTNLSDKEKWKFFKALSAYDYSEEEIKRVAKFAFPELNEYMGEYKFTAINTPVPSGDTGLLSALTEYFNEYKLQKITNRIFPEFLKKVSANAVERPFNKLLPRISVVNDIDKTKAQIHFFDALGVEYLPYILAKCEKYKLQPVVHIAHCELPSITSENLEFKKFFKTVIDENGNEVLPGTKVLDELKHHSKKIDYRKCPEPVYLFKELEIIDEELRKIREMLVNQEFEKIIVISDHGASRLSVIHQHECELLELEERGRHSGRCCKSSENPNIPEAAYERGYAVLGNYDRFKGSRPANVEVHGGASLEETVVPIIEITKKPEKLVVYIVNDFIEFHNKEIVAVTIFSNIHIEHPRIIINELDNTPYECKGSVDGKHYKFEIPEIKRSGTYTVDLFDGDKPIMTGMSFKAKKATSTTRDLFS